MFTNGFIPFFGIYINIVWHIFGVMFSTMKRSSELCPNASSVQQCFCKMYWGFFGFFGNCIVLLHQSLPDSQSISTNGMICIHNLKVFCGGGEANLKQNSVSLMRKCSVFVLCTIFGARRYLQWFFSFATAGRSVRGLIFIFGLLFRTNACDVRLLYRKRDLTGALCR